MDWVFAQANHSLALAHRARAAENWSRKKFGDTGQDLKASAQALSSTAPWTGDRALAVETLWANRTHMVSDKLIAGGVWARHKVSQGFESLRAGLDQVANAIGLKSKAAPFEAGS